MMMSLQDDSFVDTVCVVLHLVCMSQSSEFSECFFINELGKSHGGVIEEIHLNKLSLGETAISYYLVVVVFVKDKIINQQNKCLKQSFITHFSYYIIVMMGIKTRISTP